MAEWRCPQNIFDQFKVDPYGARKAAFDWLEKQPVAHGDTVVLPDPETGAPMIVEKTGTQ